MEVVSKKRLRRTWTVLKLALFAGFFILSVVALISIGIYGYAKIAGPPPLHVPQTTVFYADDGAKIGEAVHNGQNRYWVSMDKISKPLVQATLSVEDKRFYEHHGFDLKRMAGSALEDIATFSKAEGASTITMQYARNLYLSSNKNWGRKLHEALYTTRLEANYSKNTILEGYLNTIYYGKGVYGIQAAAQYYFGKDAQDLTLPEASMLAGIPKGPGTYSPAYDNNQAKERQRTVLQAMANAGAISQQQARQAAKKPLDLTMKQPASQNKELAPYFQKTVEQVLRTQLDLSPQTTRSGGLHVYTTLDPHLQKLAKHEVDDIYPEDSKLQTSLVAMDPRSGKVRALIGGRDFEESSFNRAVDARRQPGSSFKPFLYYAAIKNGFTPSTQLKSEPTTFHYNKGKSTYKPHNFGHYYAKDFITLMQALALSDNIYAVKTNMFIGPDKLVNTAKKAGITTHLDAWPSLALGTKPVSMLDMVRGYSTLANGGYRTKPRFIEKVVKPDGEVIYDKDAKRKQVLDPKAAFIDAHMMTGTFDENLNDYTTVTGRTVNDYLHKQVAGKSGTTSTDSWMLGFTPKLATGVWTGYDKGQSLDPHTDMEYSKKVWGHFMKEALKGAPEKSFHPPKGVVGAWVDPNSGKLASEDCPKRRYAYYIKGTEPTTYCKEHAPNKQPKKSSPPSQKHKNPFQRFLDWIH